MPDLIFKDLRMNSRKFAMNYGAILGLCLVAIATIIWSFGIDKNDSLVPSILNNSLIIMGITYTIIQFRDTENSGFISYFDSLKLGTSVAFFSSLILAFYTFIFINYIEPNTLNEILVEAEQAILESKPEISDEELDLALDMTTKFIQPHWMLILGVLGGTFMGFLWSIFLILPMMGAWRVYEKANQIGWACLIPVYNFYILTKIVGKPDWWWLLLFIPFVNLIILIIVLNELSKSFGKSTEYTLGLLFLGFIFYPLLGLSHDEYIGPGGIKEEESSNQTI